MLLWNKNTYLIDGCIWLASFGTDDGFEPEEPGADVLVEPYKLRNGIVLDVAEFPPFQLRPALSVTTNAENVVENRLFLFLRIVGESVDGVVIAHINHQRMLLLDAPLLLRQIA